VEQAAGLLAEAARLGLFCRPSGSLLSVRSSRIEGASCCGCAGAQWGVSGEPLETTGPAARSTQRWPCRHQMAATTPF